MQVNRPDPKKWIGIASNFGSPIYKATPFAKPPSIERHLTISNANSAGRKFTYRLPLLRSAFEESGRSALAEPPEPFVGWGGFLAAHDGTCSREKSTHGPTKLRRAGSGQDGSKNFGHEALAWARERSPQPQEQGRWTTVLLHRAADLLASSFANQRANTEGRDPRVEP